MFFYAHLLFFCSITYLAMGIVVYFFDRKKALNRAFLALNLSLFAWAFFIALSTIAPDKSSCNFWASFAVFGYGVFPSVSTHFFLIFAKKDKILKNWWQIVLLYLPAVVFIVQVFRQRFFVDDYYQSQNGWISVTNTSSIWFLIYMTIVTLSGVTNIYLNYHVIKEAESSRARKQAKTMIISELISFNICLGYVAYTRVIATVDIPDLTVVGFMIWIFGMLYAIIKYRLMIITPTIAAESILQTIIDSVILVNPKGIITYVNTETLVLLGYESTEIIGASYELLFPKDIKVEMKNILKLLEQGEIRNKDTFFVSKNNVKIPILSSAAMCKDSDDNLIGFVVLSRDITKIKAAEGHIKHLALHDALTGLPNRALLREQLNHAIAEARRNSTYIAYILLDLDRFKEINDVFGHSVGDMLLIEIANRLSDAIRESDMVARLGGDEFVILKSDLKSGQDYAAIVGRILECVSKPVIIESHELKVTVSAGISMYPNDGLDGENLLKCADLALYRVKKLGRNSCCLYDVTMSTEINKRVALEEKLRKSIIQEELLAYYQPICDIHSDRIIGVEALARWRHPELGIILPDEFIPIAEANGFILELGEWVLRTACNQARVWQQDGHPNIYVTVNLSRYQFIPKSLARSIREIVHLTGINPENLILEISESTIMHDLEKTLVVLTELKALNVKVAIDNFGIEHSSLLYLRTFPIYAIKIDKCYIKEINNNPEYVSIVSAIVSLAHSMNLKVIAEGIEHKSQLETLQTLKHENIGSSVCDEAQGYWFCKPISEDEIIALIKNSCAEEPHV